MSDKCDLLDKCGFFMNYTSHLEVLKKKWIALYCENSVNSEFCERKKYRNTHGTPPGDNMAPTGTLL